MSLAPPPRTILAPKTPRFPSRKPVLEGRRFSSHSIRRLGLPSKVLAQVVGGEKPLPTGQALAVGCKQIRAC